MNEAIKYYQRKLDDANDLTGIAYVCKLIQLGHQPTIDKTLTGLKQVQYPRHFPNHLVVQLARLNRDDINESLIEYFKIHFKASNTEWHAISTLQDDRVVETIVNAIKQYEVSYYSRKVVSRCIHLLGRISSHTAYLALRDLIEDYFRTDNRFLDNYEIPLASEALDALRRIDLAEVTIYLQNADARYQARIEDELSIYPERLSRERTEIGINLHEGSALARMRQYALPTLIEWHKYHPSQQVHDLALNTLLSSLQSLSKQKDKRVRDAIHYLLSCYDELKAHNKLKQMLQIIEHDNDPSIVPFAWQVFDDDRETPLALTVLANQHAESAFDGVVHHLQVREDISNPSHRTILNVKAYINYFGHIDTPQSEAILVDLYNKELPHLQIAIAEAMLLHAKKRDSALNFLSELIENNTDLYTVKQAILLLGHVGKRSLLILLSLLEPHGHRTQYAVEALGTLRQASAIPHLLQLLLDTDPDNELTKNIMKTLERIGTETSFAAINTWEATYG